MVKHRQDGQEWWCLPGGAVEEGESPAQAVLRELQEECGVEGTIVREVSRIAYTATNQSYTCLVDIGTQEPSKGTDPEFRDAEQVLADVKWLSLDQIPERDRVFLWAAGLLCIQEFLEEVSSWGDATSYPGADPS